MIQSSTYLNVVDNSGAKTVSCIKVLSGYKKRYAFLGDLILVSVKTLRNKRRITSKVKKGELHRALIVRTKFKVKTFSEENFNFFENAVVLVNSQNKLLGSRIFGCLPKKIRYTKFLRLGSLSAGLV